MYKVNQEAYARLFKILIHEDATAHDLAEETGLHLVTIQTLMRCFKKHKLVHVSAWEPDLKGRDCTPVYTWGEGKDKARRRKSRAKIAKDYRARKLLRLAQDALTRKADPVNVLKTDTVRINIIDVATNHLERGLYEREPEDYDTA